MVEVHYTERGPGLILNIFNRHVTYKPSACTDFRSDITELGLLIIELKKQGHRVVSISMNGNVADMVIIANSDDWFAKARKVIWELREKGEEGKK